ncbi:IclR family transcriptional regulator [Bacillus sp. BRMEA1]|uniref:IclR family transcriptional regulator n=1 Tax=Neobacillus endophyticus TaxID=2738405 RepID=UPI0015655E1C|nr:IclR family transcriptional regulator [Neobacillus endophyticus]NRD80080.1 IclR family transcriptional regulator [Neobacillus endophyticus]
MQSIDRAMQVIQALTKNETKMWYSITDLSKECELPASTMHRLLQSMKKHELIQQDPKSKLYSMGNAWLEYGLKMYDSIDFVAIIRPEMEKLMHEVEESVYFSKPIGLEALIVERIDCQHNPIRIYDQLGLRIPLNIGAANKVMLANMPQSEAINIVHSLVPNEEQDEFITILSEIRRKGFGESHGEKTPGTSSVAAPLFNNKNELIGAISIGYINFKVTDERQNYLIEKIIEYGWRISSKLGSK